MEYYKSNALYEYINAKKLLQFRFVVGNAWQLVYGDNKCRPLVLIFAVGVPMAQIDNLPDQNERDAFNLLNIVAVKSSIPIRYVRFAYDLTEVEDVRVSDGSFTYSSLRMLELSSLFASFGLPVSDTKTAKYLNDKTSSAYHKWQRSSLGAALTVSDIDLWRLSRTGNPETVYELKRSYIELNKWKPYTDDYRNFMLISNLCNKAELQFKIIYNQRIKTPFEDKIDRLKIFKVDFSTTTPIAEEGIITLDELENT